MYLSYDVQSKISRRAPLILELQEHFKLKREVGKFTFYPFSNELGFDQLFIALSQLTPKIVPGKLHLALLFGESHWISLLPIIAQHADTLILADIEPQLYTHNAHLHNCLCRSANRDEFKKNYLNDYASFFESYFKMRTPMTKNAHESLVTLEGNAAKTQNHFLYSEENYQRCKKALKRLHLICIDFNLGDEMQVMYLNRLIHKHNGVLTFCNFTNIHDFLGHERMMTSLSKLFSGYHDIVLKSAIILYGIFMRDLLGKYDLWGQYCRDYRQFLTILQTAGFRGGAHFVEYAPLTQKDSTINIQKSINTISLMPVPICSS